ncbi:hypothetical protein BBL81_16650 [Vibrio parahaemolyticus]|uniref:hypothetical protein n=1 Tax=Vibrio parahaemolyticus TaxID=670 RepID=UPI00084BB2E8|nr:hypothetical protein [Vibrio parahaemolyticus]ODW12768.1 hypothetical protein BBL80_15305 [Vibrio parahaemolyticus]ODW21918.1 hypothetical protein BBL81_16650 [Vibrio parahaemolyticus]
MAIYQEITLSSRKGVDYIISELLNFAECESNWCSGESYFDHISHAVLPGRVRTEAALLLKSEYGFTFSSFDSPNTLSLNNIVPLYVVDALSIVDFNDAANHFYKTFGSYCKSTQNSVRITITKESYELHEIITAKYPLELFELYLKSPCTWHHSDQEILDRFIASYVRHARKPFPSLYIQEYLESECDWHSDRVDRLINYIETGIRFMKKFNQHKW